jgi:hypothetical protein
VADGLTKALPKPQFVAFREQTPLPRCRKLGVVILTISSFLALVAEMILTA